MLGKDINTVKLILAENILNSTKNIINKLAQAEYKKAKDNFTIIKKTQLEIVSDFVYNCQFAHTWRGSFGFSIGTPLNLKSIGLFNDQVSTETYERKISKRINSGMRIIKQAETLKTENYIVDNVDSGFDGRMLSDLLEIADSTNHADMEYSTTWSPALEIGNEFIDQNNITLNDSTFRYIEKAAIKLGIDEEVYDIRFIGFPELFQSTKESIIDHEQFGDRRIGIKGVSTITKDTTLKFIVPYDEYLIAVHAHENGKDLSVKCRVKKKIRGWEVLSNEKIELSN